eukprot:CAMPEP_0117688548 /NCGR_PEP_ID=MMETSP0804-20121206/23906_1 /TAXON_ID=1074897 /ORGANISM="Tetraselmis astigmatica, Strain CCMP880" /LENGTH=282 /DNA_ID=CAMNT_0005501043 /DNA_START=182 /DNA_END=1026 /DNA_ORIENTATION=-
MISGGSGSTPLPSSFPCFPCLSSCPSSDCKSRHAVVQPPDCDPEHKLPGVGLPRCHSGAADVVASAPGGSRVVMETVVVTSPGHICPRVSGRSLAHVRNLPALGLFSAPHCRRGDVPQQRQGFVAARHLKQKLLGVKAANVAHLEPIGVPLLMESGVSQARIELLPQLVRHLEDVHSGLPPGIQGIEIGVRVGPEEVRLEEARQRGNGLWNAPLRVLGCIELKEILAKHFLEGNTVGFRLPFAVAPQPAFAFVSAVPLVPFRRLLTVGTPSSGTFFSLEIFS